MITVRLFAAAADVVGTKQLNLDATTVAEIVTQLSDAQTTADVISRCSFLVDGARATEETTLAPGATVDVLPPFAGG
ncbi:MoaD/ThiS family protein [Enteractinococcus coprophilus]|uniref:Molybdopterin converting factor small subunit n=1 Tax=Enteractinococcus coprophilus TaxID=1027633 RepID=A0A543AIT8_9MICC|nr:MoaD/ThiS family protein [Enteractinococcus coprophilus]TQL72495.1 molybdopterin converting factor small subunit [Enteractinococcus coprophilus]